MDVPDEIVQELRATVAIAPAMRTTLTLTPWVVGAGAVIAGLLYISQYGLHLKAKVIQEGSAAVGHLVAAKDDLERMDLAAAQDDFARAHTSFDAAHQDLGIIGTGVGDILAFLPGGGRIRAARGLITAGQLISQSGASLAQALQALSGSGALLDPAGDNRTSLGQVLLPMQEALGKADTDMTRAADLLEAVDASVLPGDAQGQFTSFRDRLPQVRSLIDHGSETVAFLSRLVGTDRPRRYLLLFQNSSELRPTGGFPGSYGLVTFDNGRMRQATADDIYNPDGQIRQQVVPPLQLQHITPSWGMRDANWFIDFPVSARKVMEFYRKGGGAAVDGVVAIQPDILADILRITGPVSLPQYGLVLRADNLLVSIQSEIENNRTAREPKQIILDLMPVVMQRLAALPPAQWMQALDVFTQGLARRDLVMYLDDDQLQRYVATQGWDGRVVDTPGDYLMVDISNIKGAKADAVTDTSEKLESWLDQGTMVHRLTLTRTHNDGTSQYPFYHATNYSYVRVLVPAGSTLRGIAGNDRPDNRPMTTYDPTAERDPDLARLENTYRLNPTTGATTYEESGKTGFGFWMKVEPGRTQSVQLEYAIPARAAGSTYHLYVQRQPGLDLTDLEFTLQKGVDLRTASAGNLLTEWPDSWRLHSRLEHDLDLTVKLE